MELKVWVEGIQRVICGVTEETTCQDVVIALAHATGRTGRFTLIEKWRENERLVPPGECPLKSLRNWGEYASDVHYSLKYSGDRTRNSGKHIKSRTDNNKFLHNFSPHNFEEQLGTSLNQQQLSRNRANVKRNLTFSGAHHHLLTPLKSSRNNQRKLPPFENSSLDSVEEQSSLSSHSSNSPYSSFQSAGSGSQHHSSYSHHPGSSSSHNHHHHSPHENFDDTDLPIATSSISSTPVTSPKDTPTNSLERTSNHESEHIDSPSGLNNTHQRRDHLFSPPVRHQKHPAPQSLDTSHIQGQFHNNIDTSVNSNSSHLSSSSSTSSHNLPADHSKTGSDLNYNNQNYHKHFHHRLNDQQNTIVDSSVYNHEDNPNVLHSSSNNNSSHQAFTQHQHKKLDSSSSETDENRNSKNTKDLTALLESKDFTNVSRDDLVRLVNLQIERLNSYEDRLKNIDTEILFHEQKDGEALKQLQHIKSESILLTSQDSEIEAELQEFEIVSWDDKLELERKNQRKIQTEIESLQNKLSKCEIEVLSYKQKAEHLHVEMEGERQIQAKQHTLQEVQELKNQIQQKVEEHHNNERTLEELSSHLKQLESGILDKKTAMSGLERSLKDVNMELFNSKPATGVVIGESADKPHARHGSESGIPFARSSSSRSGNARKIPNNSMSLKEAIESEPQGYWV